VRLGSGESGVEVGGGECDIWSWEEGNFWFLVIALRPQTPKHVRGGWSHYTDTSEPVDGNGAQNMVAVQSGFEPATFERTALTGPTGGRYKPQY
jgi:hypothetical protein